MTRADIVLQGKYSEYEALQGFIALFAEREDYSVQFVERLQLSLKEAFVNAVRHGNRKQEDLTVSCGLLAAENILLASVHDCGNGFNPDELPDPLGSAHLFNLSGRGIYIIKSIAEIISMERDEDGSVLTLRYIPY